MTAVRDPDLEPMPKGADYWRGMYRDCKRKLDAARSAHRDELARLKTVCQQKHADEREKLAKQYQCKLDAERQRWQEESGLREDALKKKLIELESELSLYRDKSKGHGKSEKGDLSGTDVNGKAKEGKKKKKKKGGKRQGTRGGRQRHAELPSQTVTHELDPQAHVCGRCGGVPEETGLTDKSEEVCYKVELVRIVHERAIYRTCHCPGQPSLLRAPLPPKAMSKSLYDDALWIDVLVKKYGYLIPLTRIIGLYRSEGLKDVKGPCLCRGIERMSGFLEPLYDAIKARSKQAMHWHSDGSCLPVFIRREEKSSFNCCMWLYKAIDTVVFDYSPDGKAEHVEKYFAAVERAAQVISADRAAVFKNLGFAVAFCWAHIRRDFIKVGRYANGQRTWAQKWLVRIRRLYRLNNARVRSANGSADFAKYDRQLREAVTKMKEALDAELSSPQKLPEVRLKVLTSLSKHWAGATLFVDLPQIPMDNNAGEREFRELAKLRNNSNGVFSEKFAKITAMMLSIFATLRLNHIDARAFLKLYFEAVALNGSKPLSDIVPAFLPWSLSEEVSARLEGAPPDTS